jgi:hypothetical protein
MEADEKKNLGAFEWKDAVTWLLLIYLASKLSPEQCVYPTYASNATLPEWVTGGTVANTTIRNV